MKSLFFLVLFSTGLLAACATNSGGNNPAETVEKYLEAKVAGDESVIRELLCLPMEADLQREAASFSSVTGVKIEGMQCQSASETEIVECTGEIIATYGTEDTSFPLTSYRVVQEDGVWKWCGEAG